MPDPIFDGVETVFLRSLASRGVRYVLSGGHAVCYYGHERHINDIDVVVEDSDENAQKLLRLLQEDFHQPLQSLTLKSETQLPRRIHIPNYNIDVLTSIDIAFSDLYGSRVPICVNDIEISMVSLKHLLRMKGNSSRAKDQEDYLELIRINERP
jgi:predicted nucleotidyltransferase